MSAKMTPEQLRVWEDLQLVMDGLRREVGRDLWNQAQLSDAEFTVLAHLHGGGERGVRPAECARAIGWDSSRLAHQLRRLEKRGLVTSIKPGGEDGRASFARLTDEGRSVYRRALGPHLASARRWFADGLPEDQLHALGRALETLLTHIRTVSDGSGDDETRTA